MSRSGSAYSVPRDANRVPFLVAASTADGITPVVLEADPTTHQLQVSSSGGGGGTQYAEGATTSPATGNVALGRYSSSTPSLSSNQLESLQLDSSGNLKVKLSGDTTATGTITGSGQSVTIATNGQTSVGIQVSGTFSGTILIKGSVDGTSYTPTSAVALSNGAISTTITSSYTGQANAGGLVSFQLTAITWATGNASVTLVASVANSTVMLDNPLPIGTNSIGNVGLNAGTNAIGSITNTTFAVTQSTASNLKSQPIGGDLTSGSQKSQIVDGSGNVIASTSNALNTYSTNPNTQYTESNTTFPALGNVALGRYVSSPVSLTNGELLGLQLDVNGNLKTTFGGTVTVTGSINVSNQNTQYTEATTVAPNTGIGTLGMAKYVAAGLGTLTNNKMYALNLDSNGYLTVGGSYIAQMSGDLGNLNSTTNSNNTTANTYGTMQAGLDTATGNAQFINVDATGNQNVNVVSDLNPNPSHNTLNYGQVVLGTSATVFTGSSVPVYTHVIVKPLSTNVASVYIGDASVGTSTGIELAPFNSLTTPNGSTDQIKIPINNVDLLFGISTNGTDGISWLAV